MAGSCQLFFKAKSLFKNYVYTKECNCVCSYVPYNVRKNSRLFTLHTEIILLTSDLKKMKNLILNKVFLNNQRLFYLTRTLLMINSFLFLKINILHRKPDKN